MKVNNLLKGIKTSNKGITLIALIITIIVLLILSGVSIATLSGDNGILKQAREVTVKSKKAQIEEEIRLAYNAMQIDSYEKNWQIEKRAEGLQEELRRMDSSATVVANGTDLEIVYKEYQTSINEKGIMGELVEAEIIISEFRIKGTPAEKVPVPENFVHVGGRVNEGYVISDNAADEGKGVDSDELVGNQFVWVPVEKDQKLRINVKSKEEIENIVITDPYGDELLNVSNVGKNYSNTTIEPTINGYYNLEVTTASGTEEKMIDVYSLYAMRMTEIDTYGSDEYAKLNGYENALEFINAELSEFGTFGSVEEGIELVKMMYKNGLYTETEEIDHATKVNENGGFFIGRYEATYENGKVASKKATKESVYSSSDLENGMLWNCISQIEALAKAKEYNTTLNSTLPTGAAWDRVIGWLYETGEKTKTELMINSTSWGNYYNDTFSNTTSLIKPGEFKETRANNIFDLAGNVEEWTTESYNSAVRVHRGGFYAGDGFRYPASNIRFYYNPAYSGEDIGLRLTLFM